MIVPVSYKFDNENMPVGTLDLFEPTLKMLADFPDHHIAFGMVVNDDGSYTVTEASLIPNNLFKRSIQND